VVNERRLTDTFLRLASIPGLSRQEREVAEAAASELRACDFTVSFDDAGEKVGGNTGNVIASKKGAVSGGCPIALNAHLDTVGPVEGWSYRAEDGTIHSGGTSILGADDRIGIAAILEAVRVLAEDGIPHADLQVILTIAEEVGLLGAKHLDCTRVCSRYVFVIDSSQRLGALTICGPSQDTIAATFHGRAAHAADPDRGISAIVAASKAVARMQLGRLDPETVANVGIIRGGRAGNIVPDRCEVRAEARSRDESKLRAQVQHMTEALREGAAEAGAEVEIQVTRSYSSYRLTEQDPPVALAYEAARAIGVTPEFVQVMGGSDANVFNSIGLPSLALWMGLRDAHSLEESAIIGDAAKCAELLIGIARLAAKQ